MVISPELDVTSVWLVSKIAIIKAATHSSYISKNGGKIYQLAKEFFAEQEQGVLL